MVNDGWDLLAVIIGAGCLIVGHAPTWAVGIVLFVIALSPDYR